MISHLKVQGKIMFCFKKKRFCILAFHCSHLNGLLVMVKLTNERLGQEPGQEHWVKKWLVLHISLVGWFVCWPKSRFPVQIKSHIAKASAEHTANINWIDQCWEMKIAVSGYHPGFSFNVFSILKQRTCNWCDRCNSQSCGILLQPDATKQQPS